MVRGLPAELLIRVVVEDCEKKAASSLNNLGLCALTKEALALEDGGDPLVEPLKREASGRGPVEATTSSSCTNTPAHQAGPGVAANARPGIVQSFGARCQGPG